VFLVRPTPPKAPVPQADAATKDD